MDIKELPDAYGDQAMIRQVVVNLLSNAIKFTAPQENARIEIGGGVEENETVYSIKDNGVGFDMQYVHKLFGVFQRLHTSKEFEGTGVGLAIIQRVISRHGGRVWAEGTANEGATFYFTLPKRPATGVQ
jgi:light-regulated signal transduction histidine kinase (bacteriophytochrome)